MGSYNRNFSYKKTMTSLSVLSLAAALLSVLVSDIFLAPTAAFLAVLMLCERKQGRVLSFVIPAAILSINVVALGLMIIAKDLASVTPRYSIAAVEGLVLGILLFLFFSKNLSKSESVILMTVVSVVFIFVNLWLLLSRFTGDFSIAGNIKTITELNASYRETFIETMMKVVAGAEASYPLALGEMYTEETIASLYDTLISYTPAAVLLCAFSIVGILCKIFTFTVHRITGSSRIYEWKFAVKPIFAYVFCALFTLNVFFSGIGGAFTVVIANLYTVFMLVFAYVGFDIISRMILMRRRRSSTIFILLACVIIGGSIAFNLLSVFAVVTTIITDVRRRRFNSFNNEDRS